MVRSRARKYLPSYENVSLRHAARMKSSASSKRSRLSSCGML